jgi:hypothetical protein
VYTENIKSAAALSRRFCSDHCCVFALLQVADLGLH